VGAPYTARNLECLRMDGRLVQVGLQQGAQATVNLQKVMQKRLVLTGSTMRPRTAGEKAEIARSLLDKVWPLFERRQIRPVVDRVFPFEEVRAAHEYLEAGRHFGKVILRLK
jgi:NADPH:quinone reductase